MYSIMNSAVRMTYDIWIQSMNFGQQEAHLLSRSNIQQRGRYQLQPAKWKKNPRVAHQRNPKKVTSFVNYKCSVAKMQVDPVTHPF